jgi:catechol 2,3-dioxygenase-like lactoylglutathione lyase family enzyme
VSLRAIELKPFVPAKDFERSKAFYQDLGFTMASDRDGIAYFHQESVSFLLQDFYAKELAENLMLHLLVENVDAWWAKLDRQGISTKYGVKQSAVMLQPWRMRDFVLHDPSGVLWRIGQHTTQPVAS